jgi:virginiamycin B lyase
MDSVTFADQKKSRTWWYAAVLALALITALALWRLATPPAIEVVEYRMLEPKDTPTALAVAPDGTVWFTIDFAAAIGRIRDGKVERLPKARVNVEPIGIAVAADGSAWITDSESRQVSRVAPDGKITSIQLETPVVRLGKVAVARDGSVWFAEATAYSISRIKDGKLERHIIDSIRGGPLGVAAAPDGSVWATLQSANQLLRITPDGKMSSFDIPTRSSSPGDITVDGNGVVWFNEFRGNRIGRLANDRIDEFPLGAESAGLTGLAAAPDGSVWFGMLRKGSLGRLRDGKIEKFKLPRDGARPYSVAVDPVGNVWYTDITGYVGMLPADAAKR